MNKEEIVELKNKLIELKKMQQILKEKKCDNNREISFYILSVLELISMNGILFCDDYKTLLLFSVALIDPFVSISAGELIGNLIYKRKDNLFNKEVLDVNNKLVKENSRNLID